MSAVIDASALLAVLLDEPGADIAIRVLRGSSMLAVNLAESCARGEERGADADQVLRALRRFEMTVVPFDRALAIATAALRADPPLGGISW